VWGDLAGPVLDDQLAALDAALARFDVLDGDRVGIRGWSFGGYLAALAVLRRPDRFHAAVAGAPVTAWSLYDTHYTERYLGHPDTHPDHYRRSDLLPDLASPGDGSGDGAAARRPGDGDGSSAAGEPGEPGGERLLRRPLLLVHGLADDNVVAAHTLRLSSALLADGSPHQVLPLSGVTHMASQVSVAENLLRLQLSFLDETIGASAP
jgi:dipeptidyl-peptidase-4